MIKNILKNFFKNLIYIFIPMGCFYLCLLLLLFALAGAAISTVGKTAADFSLLLNQSIEDSETLLADFFSYAFSQINQSEDFTEILKEIFSTEWISKTVYGFLDTLNVSVDALKIGIEEIIAELRSTVATVLFASGAALILSVWATNFVTHFFLARKTARKTIPQKALDLLLQFTLIAAAMKLATELIKFHISLPLLAVLLYAVVSCFLSLLSAWLVYRKKNLPFSNVVNWRNIKNHLLGSLILLLISGIAVLLIALLNVLLAVLIAVPLTLYCVNIIDVNADSYVKSLTLSTSDPTSAA